MQIRTSKLRAAAAFTLLEMLVVILIIGILSTALAVNVPKWLDNAKMTASEANMKKIHMYLLEYSGLHNGNLPNNSGQRFFLRPWKDGNVEKVEQNAQIFFSPAWSFEQCAADLGYEEGEIDIVEYLDDWDSIGRGHTSYAGFSSERDREARRRLQSQQGSTTIVADASMWHRTAWLYMTADGATHKLLKPDILERTGMTEEDLFQFEIGPGCELEELQTVTND